MADNRTNGRSATLFAVADPEADPHGLVTRFLHHESLRLKHRVPRANERRSFRERLALLVWYLTDYRRENAHADSVALSAAQIEFLNGPALISHLSPAVTVGFINAVSRDLPAHTDLGDPATLREAVYWWCIESVACRREGRLVTPEQAAILQAGDRYEGEAYPLNVFMSLFLARQPDLCELDMEIARDRAAFLHYLVLYSYSHPHIGRFLPATIMQDLARGESPFTSVFDRVTARLALPDAEEGDGDVAEARRVREMGLDLLARASAARSAISMSRPAEVGTAVIGPLVKASGLGQAARLSLDILRRCEAIAPAAVDFAQGSPAPSVSATVALSRQGAPREINLIHLNADVLPLAFAERHDGFFDRSYNIGYFFWELNVVPESHRLALDLVDEIWVASEFGRDVYSRVTAKPVINVGMAVEPPPSLNPARRVDLGLPADAFVFLSTFDAFSFVERKNPLGVVDSFRRAFPRGDENVRLVLKTQNRFLVDDPHQVAIWSAVDRAIRVDPRIVLINETYSYRDVMALKLACDCYVSLHRSEGWGFGLLEAMQLGVPVIATAYSGNMDFCSPETASLVGFELVPVQQHEYLEAPRGSVWADPDLAEAAGQMATMATDPAPAKATAERAKAEIAARFGIDAIAERYRQRLTFVRANLLG